MARQKKAAEGADHGAGEALRSRDSGEAGRGDDAAAGARLAVRILTKELRRIETLPKLDLFTAQMVATYARTLSAIERDRRKGASGEYSGKSTEELLELARNIPELRDALSRMGHAD